MSKLPTDSVTLIGLIVVCASFVIPLCMGVTVADLKELGLVLSPVITGFFTYRGSKMTQNGNGTKPQEVK
jgi:hypothetical protein